MSGDIVIVFTILLAAIILFATEKIRNDFVAILIMISLAWTKILSPEEAFSGFSSNAIIAVMGVMIIGFGIEKTGVMDSVARFITKKAGKKENRIITIVAGAAGLISSFLQNIGAVALFLPAVKKLSSEANINPKKIIMPVAFAGILGGTLTMVASGPLIILNDLLQESGYQPFGLFAVTPIGLALLVSGIIYFYFFANKLLAQPEESVSGMKDELIDIYDLPNELYEIDIPEGSSLVGKTIEQSHIWEDFKIHILGVFDSGNITYIPWRKTRFHENQTIVVFGENKNVDEFCDNFRLMPKKNLSVFKDLTDEKLAGFAEIIFPRDSALADKTLKEIAMRKNYKVEPILYIGPEGKELEFSERKMKPGLKAIIFGRWDDIELLKQSPDVIVISDVKPPKENIKSDKKIHALVIFALTIALIITGLSLPLSFFTGAMLMVVTKLINIDELYQAIDWSTIFLLAGLIPLGLAFEKSGAAAFVADATLVLVESWPLVLIIMAIGLISAFFSLFMSNVAATVLLVPLVIAMAQSFSIDPRAMALLVAVSTSNSFIIPTHQVNAYIMSPGNYKTSDFTKLGLALSIIFLIVATLVIYFAYI